MAIPVTELAKKLKPSKTNRGSKTGLPKVNVSLTRRRRSNRVRQRLSFMGANKENDPTASSYDVLEKEVLMKDGCRSTAFGVKLFKSNFKKHGTKIYSLFQFSNIKKSCYK